MTTTVLVGSQLWLFRSGTEDQMVGWITSGESFGFRSTWFTECLKKRRSYHVYCLKDWKIYIYEIKVSWEWKMGMKEQKKKKKKRPPSLVLLYIIILWTYGWRIHSSTRWLSPSPSNLSLSFVTSPEKWDNSFHIISLKPFILTSSLLGRGSSLNSNQFIPLKS